MKLQTRYAISSIMIALIVIAVSFFLIEQRTNDEFRKFTIEKIKNGKNQPAEKNNNPPPPSNPNDIHFAPDSPEARFVQATRSTLLIASLLGISLAIAISFIFSKFLLEKISRLQTAMNEYMKRGVAKKVAHSSKDEIDKLTEVYNILIEKIDNQENIRREFFIDMSHELRTPLTAVKGYLEGLSDNVFAASREKEIQKKALAETDRMVHLIKEMATLAKAEAENQELLKEKLHLENITKDVISLLKNEADAKEMKVEIMGGAMAEINRDKFKQIIINLLDNAISHGEKGGQIKIRMKNEDSKAYWIIENKAIGISQKDFDSIFERFYRSDKSRFYDGKKLHLGIGLNIVKKLVDLHDGKIVASLKDGWVEFKVII